jgi:hypothetical protein
VTFNAEWHTPPKQDKHTNQIERQPHNIDDTGIIVRHGFSPLPVTGLLETQRLGLRRAAASAASSSSNIGPMSISMLLLVLLTG